MKSERQVIFIVVGKVLALLATLLIPMLLTRFLTKEEYGLYAQFYTVVPFVAAIFGFGFHISLFYFFHKTVDKKQLIWQTFIILIVLSFLAVLFFRIPFINQYLLGSGGLEKYFFYVAFSIILTVPIAIMEPLYILKKDNKVSMFYPPSEVLIKAIFVIITIFIWTKIEAVFIGIILSSLLIYSFVIQYIFRVTKGIRIKMNMKLLLDRTKYSLPFGLAIILKTITFRIDKIICLSILTASDYAIYAVAFYGIPGIQQIYDSLVQVYIINMTEKYAEGEIESVKNIYKRLTIKTFSYTVPLIFIVALFANEIIVLLFTEKYIDSVPYFRLYLISFLFVALGSGLILRSSGHTKRTLYAYLFSASISIPLTIYLINQYYIMGAMIGTLLGCLLPVIFNIKMDMITIKSNFKEHLPWIEFSKIFLISILTIIPFSIIHIFYNPNIFFSFLIGLAYLLLVSYFEYLNNIFIIDSDIVTLKMKYFRSRLKKNLFIRDIEQICKLYDKQ